MRDVHLMHRELTELELAQMRQGFDEHQSLAGVPVTAQRRHTVVAVEGKSQFIGSASNLETDNHWFYLSDLWVEETYRGQGLGTALLQRLESRLIAIGVTDVYTWTGSFQAPGFYSRHGYDQFCEFENYYLGHSRLGFRKRLTEDYWGTSS